MQAVTRIDGEQLQQQKKEAARTEEEKCLGVLFKFGDARLAAQKANAASGSCVGKDTL